MPAILERLVGQLQAKGMPKSKAFAVATSSLQRAGDLKKGTTKATSKGLKRGMMSPGARAKDRAAKAGGRKPGEYKYNAKTNRATLVGG
jgi:hypothetical protein